jgi:hypothetical protein
MAEGSPPPPKGKGKGKPNGVTLSGGVDRNASTQGLPAVLEAGTHVRIFHRYSQDPNGYFMADISTAGLMHPSVGRTDGWTTGVVSETWHATAFDHHNYQTWVQIQWTHNMWYNRRGYRLDVSKSSMVTQRVLPAQIRLLDDPKEADDQPLLSMVHVRWGGEYTVDPVTEGVGGWGQIGSTPSDNFINGFDEHVFQGLGPRYETHSIFIQNSHELDKIVPHLMRSLARGLHRAAFYFMWPIAFQDGHEYSGYVEREYLIRVMTQMESAGFPTRFTHPVNLYKVFASKEWTAQMCLTPDYCVPLTTMVPRQLIVSDPMRAAQTAHNALQKLAEARDAWAGTGQRTKINKGVCKLGWSWEARDVMSWESQEEIRKALAYLGEQPGSYVDQVFCQEWVDFDVEMRHFVVEPDPNNHATWKPRKIVYTVFQGNQGNCFRNFDRFDRNGAIEKKFAGDEAAMAHAEKLAQQLIKYWLIWLQAQCCELPILTRFDILAKRVGPGRAVVYTGELTELGGCFLGWQDGPKVVFRAMLRSCFGRYAEPGKQHEAERLAGLTAN